MRTWRTTEISALIDVPTSTVRRWSELGLLTPVTPANGSGRYLEFAYSELLKAATMQRLRHEGLSFQRVRQIMNGCDDWFTYDGVEGPIQLGFWVGDNRVMRFSMQEIRAELEAKIERK